jgi:hypothetical protein
VVVGYRLGVEMDDAGEEHETNALVIEKNKKGREKRKGKKRALN